MITDELREEIRKIIKEEITSLSFLNRELKSPLQRYIRRIMFGEIKARKMYEAGFRPSEEVDIHCFVENDCSKSLSLHVDEGIDLAIVYDKLIKEKKIDCTFETFESVLLRKEKNGNRINWIQKIVRTKEVEQRSIFDLLYTLDKRIISYEKLRRERLITFTCRSFIIDGKELVQKNINDTFGIWRNKKIEQI